MDSNEHPCPHCDSPFRYSYVDGGVSWSHGGTHSYSECCAAIESFIDSLGKPVPVRQSVPVSGRDDDYPQPLIDAVTDSIRDYESDLTAKLNEYAKRPDTVPTGYCRCGAPAHPYHCCRLPAPGGDVAAPVYANPCRQCDHAGAYAGDATGIEWVRYSGHAHAYRERPAGSGRWLQL